MSTEQEEPKIVVDEDWKSRVQAEKESAGKPAAESASPSEEKPEDSGADGFPPPHSSCCSARWQPKP